MIRMDLNLRAIIMSKMDPNLTAIIMIKMVPKLTGNIMIRMDTQGGTLCQPKCKPGEVPYTPITEEVRQLIPFTLVSEEVRLCQTF